MIKIEFDASNTALANAIGNALCDYASSVGSAKVRSLKGEEIVPLDVESTGGQPESVELKVGDAPLADKVLATLGKKVTDPGVTATVKDADSIVDMSGDEPKEAVQTDVNGVPWDGNYCVSLSAKNPKMKDGSWKKKQGLDVDKFNLWYASNVKDDEPKAKEEAPVDTGAAFGAKTETAPATDAPQDVGGLMAYISERQNAGTLDQAKVNQAYQLAGFDTTALFHAENGQANIAKLYTVLQGM